MKKFLLSACLLSALAVAEKRPVVAITQIVEHPSLNAIHDGIVDEIKAAKIEVEYVREVAQGNGSIAQQIAEKFVDLKPTVAVAIATPSAQALVNTANGQIPVVFASITDPVAAKLIPDLKTPVKNITGTTDNIPLNQQLEVVKKALPNLKKLGTIYNAGDANSVASIEKLKALLKEQNIELIEVSVSKSSEVADASLALVGKAEAIFIVLENTVVSALESVVQVAEEHKIPLFSADTDSVKRGAIGALGFDYYDVGRTTGKQVVQILQGTAPEAIPVQEVEKLSLVLNPKSAEKMGLTLPEALLKEATTIIE